MGILHRNLIEPRILDGALKRVYFFIFLLILRRLSRIFLLIRSQFDVIFIRSYIFLINEVLLSCLFHFESRNKRFFRPIKM